MMLPNPPTHNPNPCYGQRNTSHKLHVLAAVELAVGLDSETTLRFCPSKHVKRRTSTIGQRAMSGSGYDAVVDVDDEVMR